MRLAVTGCGSFLGGRLLPRLIEARGAEEVVAIDVGPPPAAARARWREVDLTEPASGQRLLDVFREEEVDAVVHLAFFTGPRKDTAHAHELESIGTLNLLAAAAAAGVGQVVLRSWTAVYGARGQNPNYLTEEMPLQTAPGLSWMRDKLEAEQHAAAFARRYPDLAITVLRLATLFGPGVRTFYTRLFDRRLLPVLLGYDPLVQMLHPDDAVAAFEAALGTGRAGAFNVVPSRPIPLLSALHLAEKVPVPVAHPIAYAAAEVLWAAGVGHAPAGFVDYVRFPFVADGRKAREELGFVAKHSSRDALLSYLRYRHPHPRAASGDRAETPPRPDRVARDSAEAGP
ncbi:MAG TPA: NAD-dependent epimerase/dehydratase family protein [Vicinamibacteria bacterium]|nr:NAD-dependent epimerase/dehydratase family protein [Vicinamibacteria bacterium]